MITLFLFVVLCGRLSWLYLSFSVNSEHFVLCHLYRDDSVVKLPVAQLELTDLQRQLDTQSSNIVRQQNACSAIEDKIFEEFCQQINVANIRSGNDCHLFAILRGKCFIFFSQRVEQGRIFKLFVVRKCAKISYRYFSVVLTQYLF